MNGVIIGHGVNDHTNGSAPLRSLPVIHFIAWYFRRTFPFVFSHLFLKHPFVQISALKQNGLLQSLAATGGEQTKLTEGTLTPLLSLYPSLSPSLLRIPIPQEPLIAS